MNEPEKELLSFTYFNEHEDEGDADDDPKDVPHFLSDRIQAAPFYSITPSPPSTPESEDFSPTFGLHEFQTVTPSTQSEASIVSTGRPSFIQTMSTEEGASIRQQEFVTPFTVLKACRSVNVYHEATNLLPAEFSVLPCHRIKLSSSFTALSSSVTPTTNTLQQTNSTLSDTSSSSRRSSSLTSATNTTFTSQNSISNLSISSSVMNSKAGPVLEGFLQIGLLLAFYVFCGVVFLYYVIVFSI